jgi:hypothetical protein
MNKPSRLFASLALAVSALATPFVARAAATITIINGDPPNVGFNDPTAVPPVGGNSGITLGEQRLNVYQAVATKWGTELTSAVPILVYATWTALSCDTTSAVLGSAGPVFVSSDFEGAPFPGTWYNVALANKISGVDQVPPDPSSSDPRINLGVDIQAQFNVNLGSPTCLPGLPFYLGLDNNHGALIDFYTVLLHELGHGLGFTVLTDGSTGKRLGSPALPGVWERFMTDNTSGLTWFEMTNRQRKQSAINFRNLVWTGAAVTADAPSVLVAGTPELVLNSRREKIFAVGTASFGPPLDATGVTAALATIVTQSGEVGPGCSPFDAGNTAAVSRKVAIIDRGGCAFTQKTKNAQLAGAKAVLIANNVAGPPPGLGGTDATITIPAVGVSQDDGATLKASIRPRLSPTVTLHLNGSQLAGADVDGRVLLYTPDPYQGGSSVSHWDTIAFHNLLLEPAINGDLTHEVKPPQDLTKSLFTDIGW